MKRCKNCAWWSRYDGHSDNTWGDCKLAGSTNSHADHEESLAVAQDFEGYSASLQTHETFGCVQWQKREKAV